MIPFPLDERVPDAVCGMLPGCRDLSVRRMTKGRSTIVYRIDADGRTLYLRIWPEPSESFGPEALVHRELRRRGARVPDVLQWAEAHPALDRSFMLTTSVAGSALEEAVPEEGLPEILRAAGRQLAAVNRIPVRGFGWIRRHPEARDELEAEYPDFDGWMAGHYREPIARLLLSDLFPAAERPRIAEAVEAAMRDLRCRTPVLAHGDFDASHIYHEGRELSGLIDFGEIRGAHREYDLGHFWIDGAGLLPILLEGYRSVAPLPPGAERRIAQSGLLIACRRLGQCLLRSREPFARDLDALRRALAASPA